MSVSASIGSAEPTSNAAIILRLFILVPIQIILFSPFLWVAAKIGVSGETTFGTALKVIATQALAGILLTIVFQLLGVLVGPAGALVLFAVWIIVALLVALFITANNYGIAILHAFGLHILTAVLIGVAVVVLFLGSMAVIGTAGTTGALRASRDKISHIGNSGSFPSFSSSSSSSYPPPPSPPISQPAPAFPSQPDYSAEIDGLLNAAMHPTGPKPSLAEREDIVRTLQQRLQAQRSNISTGDARAINVYQNQFNRYVLLLNEVKAERKAHPMGEAQPQTAR